MATGTTAETSNSLDYVRNVPKEVVWEVVIVHSFTSGQADATTHSLPMNGIARHVTVTTSEAGGASVTATVAIKDNSDQTVFSDSGIAESTTNNYSIDEPLSGTIDVVVTPSTDPLSAYSVTTTIRGI